MILTLLGSLAAVIALAALAYGLGFKGDRRLTSEEEVRAMIARAAPGAQADELALDADGRAALALLTDGRLYAVRVLGARVAERVFPMASVRRLKRKLVKKPGITVVLSTAEFGFPEIEMRFRGTEPPGWLERLRRVTA